MGGGGGGRRRFGVVRENILVKFLVKTSLSNTYAAVNYCPDPACFTVVII